VRLAIVQSCYVPWKGFFDLIGRCDVYVIYDTADFSKGHWHNRNRIKRAEGNPWLTIPVKTAHRLGQPLDEVMVAGPWAESHWSTIERAYAGTSFFATESGAILKLFEALSTELSLTRINELFLRGLANRLGLKTRIVRDRELAFSGDRNERIVALCSAAGATTYLSGPAAKGYLDVEALCNAGVSVEWMTYGPYPEYEQPHGPFQHHVSVLDTLFCTGPEARNFIGPSEQSATVAIPSLS
jgi:hypothetical protein